MQSLKSNIIKLDLNLFLIINFVVAIIIFSLSLDSTFPDQYDYLALAEGILNNRFSAHFYLDSYYPATLRSPGYPLFLASLLYIFNEIIWIKFIQLILYFISIILALKILKKITKSTLPQYIFLILSTICIQIPYYSALISSELLSIFLIIFSLYLLFTKNINSPLINFLTGIVFSILVITKPSFLLLPSMLLILALFFRSNVRGYFLIFIFFLVGLIPFSAWNQANHGVFKPTTIEGMATIAHMGYWNFKLPAGYESKFDNYQSFIVQDFTNPFVYSDVTYSKNIQAFEDEWKRINYELDDLLDHSFKRDLEIMKEDTRIFITYPSNYVIKREKLLKDAIFKNIRKDPSYYLKTRAYNFLRVFFTGINKSNFNNSENIFLKFQMFLAFIISFFIIFCGFLYSTFYILKNWSMISSEMLILYSYILYTAAIHTPFSVQARYTAPIYLCLLILLSIITTHDNEENSKILLQKKI